MTTGIVERGKRTESKVNARALRPEPKGMNKAAAPRRLENVGFLCAREDHVELPVSLHQAHGRSEHLTDMTFALTVTDVWKHGDQALRSPTVLVS